MTAALAMPTRGDQAERSVGSPVESVEPVVRRRAAFGRRVGAAVGWLVIIGTLILVWPARFGGAASFVIVQGRSMEPTMHIGDVLFVRSAAEYRPGDVIVYTIPAGQPGAGTRVAHRLERIEPDGVLVLRGDNNEEVDPFEPTAKHVTGASLLNLGPAPRVALALAPYAAAVIIGVGVVLLLWPARSSASANAD